ncbi:MAG: 4Fe-4S binding protein, partial [Sphingomonadales bacterium]|nr:4Fe-4S binding protein [Sphingomonadales bacterium]
MEAWAETNEDAPVPTFVNIRENAGWSDEGPKAASKMAALIAEAQIDVAGATIVSMNSDGRTIILGQDDAALEAAKRLAQHLDVTVVLTKTDDVLPPNLGEVPVYAGTITQASGHLGNFAVTVKGLSTLDPSSRGSALFSGAGSDADNLDADILIDLRNEPALFPAPEKRDGYLRADTTNPAAVERALSDALSLVGEFEKPRYVKHAAPTCAHSRNGIVACTRCIDVCPTSAIQPDGEHVAIDPYICAGCGECSSVCPTGANSYQYPSVPGIMARAQSLISTFNKAGGTAPALLLSDASYGADAVTMMARYGRGLPARVLPFTVNTITSVGLDTLLGLVAYGA